MFIHLGGEKIIRTSELVGIFDLSIEKMSKVTKQFTSQAELDKKVEVIGEEECKSLVVTLDKVFYSPISSATLKKRAHHLYVNG